MTASTFPAGFLWGAAVGAHQTEGNNIASGWWFRENTPDSGIAGTRPAAPLFPHPPRDDPQVRSGPTSSRQGPSQTS